MSGNQDMDHTEHEIVEDYDDWCLGNGFEFIDLQDQPSDLINGKLITLFFRACGLRGRSCLSFEFFTPWSPDLFACYF